VQSAHGGATMNFQLPENEAAMEATTKSHLVAGGPRADNVQPCATTGRVALNQTPVSPETCSRL